MKGTYSISGLLKQETLYQVDVEIEAISEEDALCMMNEAEGFRQTRCEDSWVDGPYIEFIPEDEPIQVVLKQIDGYARLLMQLGFVCPHCGGWTEKVEEVDGMSRPYDRCCDLEGSMEEEEESGQKG